MMNVGLVGLGKMGILHAGVLNTLNNVKIISVAETESILTKNFKKILPEINVYQNIDNMLDSEDLDLVYITTPVISHLPLSLSCIKKETNFFVEKPLTRNLEGAKNICFELKNSDIIHSVGYNLRFVDTFSKTKNLLEQKILGDILNVNSTMYVSNIFSKPTGWRFKKKLSGGGVLLELGCHLVDLLLWYFGPISNLTGKIKSVYSEVEDFGNADLEFENGIRGELDTSWSKEGYSIPEANIEIVGSNGKLRVNQDFIDIKLKNPVSTFPNKEKRIYKQELDKGISFDVAGPDYTKEDTHVVNCVVEKKHPLIDAFEASKTQSVLDAIYESDKKNQRVEVEYV